MHVCSNCQGVLPSHKAVTPTHNHINQKYTYYGVLNSMPQPTIPAAGTTVIMRVNAPSPPPEIYKEEREVLEEEIIRGIDE